MPTETLPELELPAGYELLAANSSRQYARPRWTELQLSRARCAGAATYRLVIVGRTTVDGEEDRVRVEETASAHVVVEALAPLDDRIGRPRLTWAGKKTLLEAGEVDDDLATALEDFEAAQPQG